MKVESAPSRNDISKDQIIQRSSANMEVETEAIKSTADEKDVAFGDMIWIKLNKSSWWRAQVVNPEYVSESLKPSDNSSDEVLVRVYGSYQYWFVDPVKCRSEFERMLKESGQSCSEILQKSLEQDLSRLKRGKLKGSRSNTKQEKKRDVKTPARKTSTSKVHSEKPDTPGSKKRKQEENKLGLNSPKSAINAEEKSPEGSTRKVRVMQKLGLIPPPGSTY